MGVSFIDAFVQKGRAEGVPDHIYESVVYNLANGGVANSNKKGELLDNCPPGKCDTPVTLGEIWGYGCWCNFDPDHAQGHGLVLDDIDRACNYYSRCNACADMDGEDANPSYTCDPTTEDFTINVQWDMVNMGLTGNCESENNNDCDKHLCACQMNF